MARASSACSRSAAESRPESVTGPLHKPGRLAAPVPSTASAAPAPPSARPSSPQRFDGPVHRRHTPRAPCSVAARVIFTLTDSRQFRFTSIAQRPSSGPANSPTITAPPPRPILRPYSGYQKSMLINDSHPIRFRLRNDSRIRVLDRVPRVCREIQPTTLSGSMAQPSFKGCFTESTATRITGGRNWRNGRSVRRPTRMAGENGTTKPIANRKMPVGRRTARRTPRSSVTTPRSTGGSTSSRFSQGRSGGGKQVRSGRLSRGNRCCAVCSAKREKEPGLATGFLSLCSVQGRVLRGRHRVLSHVFDDALREVGPVGLARIDTSTLAVRGMPEARVAEE